MAAVGAQTDHAKPVQRAEEDVAQEQLLEIRPLQRLDQHDAAGVELFAHNAWPGALEPGGEGVEAEPGGFGQRLDDVDERAAQLDGVGELVALGETGVREL